MLTDYVNYWRIVACRNLEGVEGLSVRKIWLPAADTHMSLFYGGIYMRPQPWGGICLPKRLTLQPLGIWAENVLPQAARIPYSHGSCADAADRGCCNIIYTEQTASIWSWTELKRPNKGNYRKIIWKQMSDNVQNLWGDNYLQNFWKLCVNYI